MCKSGNFLDNILIIKICYEDGKTIMTRKCPTLFSDGVLPWQCKLLKTISNKLLQFPKVELKYFRSKITRFRVPSKEKTRQVRPASNFSFSWWWWPFFNLEVLITLVLISFYFSAILKLGKELDLILIKYEFNVPCNWAKLAVQVKVILFPNSGNRADLKDYSLYQYFNILSFLVLYFFCCTSLFLPFTITPAYPFPSLSPCLLLLYPSWENVLVKLFEILIS